MFSSSNNNNNSNSQASSPRPLLPERSLLLTSASLLLLRPAAYTPPASMVHIHIPHIRTTCPTWRPMQRQRPPNNITPKPKLRSNTNSSSSNNTNTNSSSNNKPTELVLPPIPALLPPQHRRQRTKDTNKKDRQRQRRAQAGPLARSPPVSAPSKIARPSAPSASAATSTSRRSSLAPRSSMPPWPPPTRPTAAGRNVAHSSTSCASRMLLFEAHSPKRKRLLLLRVVDLPRRGVGKRNCPVRMGRRRKRDEVTMDNSTELFILPLSSPSCESPLCFLYCSLLYRCKPQIRTNAVRNILICT